jgi:hypothetical protein
MIPEEETVQLDIVHFLLNGIFEGIEYFVEIVRAGKPSPYFVL